MHARILATTIVAALAMMSSNVRLSDGAQRLPPECQEWQKCRELALEARARQEYERFHDLAWRMVQTGPADDPALMYLLARAMSVSGRPRDTIVILKRLADRGFVYDAKTEEDFERARQLPGWLDLEASIDLVTAANAAPPVVPPASSAAAPTSAASAPPAVVGGLVKFDPRPAQEVSRFSTEPFVASGLAYDAVSRRFLFGDVLGRRVMVVGEDLNTPVDLVRAPSAQFHDVTAFEIDEKRGDLWVASTARNGEGGAIHRLQLSSGRSIAIIELPSTFRPVRLTDMAVGADGTILVLDSVTPRVLAVRAGAKTFEELMPLDVAAPASIAAAVDAGTAYVAHRDGIARLDLQLRSAGRLTAPDGVALAGFERIRGHRGALVGVQVLPDGSRRVVRLQLNRGRAVTEATVIEASLSGGAGPTFATVSGNDLYYLLAQQTDPAATAGAKLMDVVVKRIRLP